MSPEMQALSDSATKITDAAKSAEALLGKLSAMLIAAKNDPAKIQAIADGLTSEGNALGAAVVANTPAE